MPPEIQAKLQKTKKVSTALRGLCCALLLFVVAVMPAVSRGQIQQQGRSRRAQTQTHNLLYLPSLPRSISSKLWVSRKPTG